MFQQIAVVEHTEAGTQYALLTYFFWNFENSSNNKNVGAIY
jgi:hypothetical protein